MDLLFVSPQSFTNKLKAYFFLLLKLHVVSSVVILTLRNQHKNQQPHHRNPMLQANQSSSSCSLFSGSWVYDKNYPLYQPLSCPVVEAQFNCQGFGRPDTEYLKYRWQPANCNLPRFDGLNFLEKMKGKSVMFVGDSLGRNQWESLLCMILSGAPQSGQTQINRGEPLSTFKFLDYGLTVSYYKAPYLVDIDAVQGKRVLKLDDIRGNANAWRDVDVLSFNTGHWWIHKGAAQGWEFVESGGTMYQDMNRLVGLEIALRTWARWADSNIDSSRTKVFFQSLSPTHYNDPSEGAESTKSCYGETSPVNIAESGTNYYSAEDTNPDMMKVVVEVLRDMNYPPYLLDITMLSAMRKDAHPSIYSGDLSPPERANPHSADCSHWCLPGLPDTWNQLFYTALFY